MSNRGGIDSSNKKDCQFLATSLRMGGRLTVASQKTPSYSCVLIFPVYGEATLPTALLKTKLLLIKLGVLGIVTILATD